MSTEGRSAAATRAVRLTIDGKPVRAARGETILEAARRAGVDVPALCDLEGLTPWGGCRLCLVEVEGNSKAQAACTTPVEEGLVVRTETPRVRARRESYLRMYLSDHAAYCEPPCAHECPLHAAIPEFLAEAARGDFGAALRVLAEDLPFPGIVGRVCPGYCEARCRRREVDEAIAVCAVHRAAERLVPARLEVGPESGRRAAVLGAGPAGLACAWFLRRAGHAVTVFGAEEEPGGTLRSGPPEFRLAKDELERGLAPLWAAGARFAGGFAIGAGVSPGGLRAAGVDVVFVEADAAPLAADPFTGRTAVPGVFATPDAASAARSPVHAAAAGKRAALAMDAYLRGEDLLSLEEKLVRYAALPYLVQLERRGELGPVGERLATRAPVWLKMGIAAEPLRRPAGLDGRVGLWTDAARAEAGRCLGCTCPALGSCELQRLAVRYGITENELAAPGSRVRNLEPAHGHPFVRRTPNRCIACGRCVRVCREVAGPACYDFTGRGFSLGVDTPYGDELEPTGCLSCGRCVAACPTGALTFNRRTVEAHAVDEFRCLLCRTCVDRCPTGGLREGPAFAGARAQWLELLARGSKLAGGHSLCAGCGAPIVVRQVLAVAPDPVVVAAATGCLEVSTTIYPYTSWQTSYVHTAFENAAATLAGVETAFRALKRRGRLRDDFTFIAFGGDGGTYDIGLQSLSGTAERGHHLLYVCYDNGAYMNTGFQRSGATPQGAWTTTTPVGRGRGGKVQNRKNLTEIMVAHGLRYVAQASPHDPGDLMRKAAKALAAEGTSFLNVLSPCPRGWRSESAETIALARGAADTCFWPLFEVEEGRYRLTYAPSQKLPLAPWLAKQGRFAHLFRPGGEASLDALQGWVDAEWEKLLQKCAPPGS